MYYFYSLYANFTTQGRQRYSRTIILTYNMNNTKNFILNLCINKNFIHVLGPKFSSTYLQRLQIL